MAIFAMSGGVYAVIQQSRKRSSYARPDLEHLKKNHFETKERLEWNLRKAQQIAKLGSWEWDLRTNETLWSDQLYEIYELAKESIPSLEAIRQLIFEEDKPIFTKAIEATYQGNPPDQIRYKILTNSGVVKHIVAECEVVYDLEGRMIRISGIVQDITERLKSMEAQIDAEKKYKLIVDHSPTGIFRSTLNGKLIFVNEAMVQIFGYDSEEELMQNSSLSLYKNPQDRKKLIFSLQKNGKLEDYQIEGITKDGQSIVISQTSILAGDELHGILMDITDRVKSEQKNAALINRLKEQNNDLEEFSYIISHNLRTPIVNLMGLTKIMDQTTISPENLEILHLIDQSTTNLDLIIKDLNKTLTIRDKREEIYESVNLNTILESVKSTLQEEIAHSAVTINTNITPNDQIKSVASYVQNMLYNLIDNAIKYRSADREARVTIEFKTEGAKHQLIVSDNGIGMDLALSENKIFKLYERLHPHPNQQGRGLGLYLVKNQVNALQGKIRVESQLNEGSTFIVELPNK